MRNRIIKCFQLGMEPHFRRNTSSEWSRDDITFYSHHLECSEMGNLNSGLRSRNDYSIQARIGYAILFFFSSISASEIFVEIVVEIIFICIRNHGYTYLMIFFRRFLLLLEDKYGYAEWEIDNNGKSKGKRWDENKYQTIVVIKLT